MDTPTPQPRDAVEGKDRLPAGGRRVCRGTSPWAHPRDAVQPASRPGRARWNGKMMPLRAKLISGDFFH